MNVFVNLIASVAFPLFTAIVSASGAETALIMLICGAAFAIGGATGVGSKSESDTVTNGATFV